MNFVVSDPPNNESAVQLTERPQVSDLSVVICPLAPARRALIRRW